jgi:hypothetical protein
MLSLAKLLLPALTPSWRFFDSIGPSPRIEFALLETPEGDADWREFRPRPATLSGRKMLRRLFWNPDRNESLFLTSCAERLLETATDHSRSEIEARIAADLSQGPPYLQFRIVLVRRREARLVKEVAYASRVCRWREAA